MTKTVFRPFWSYDVLKTELWLNNMSRQGFHLRTINFTSRKFVFESGTPCEVFYRIVYDKHSAAAVSAEFEPAGFQTICISGHFSILRITNPTPDKAPTYLGILGRNKTIKFTIGIILLCLICMTVPFMILPLILFALLAGGSVAEEVPNSWDDGTVTLTPTHSLGIFDALSVLIPVGLLLAFFLALAWMIYTYFALRNTNKQLEKFCGNPINLSFTIPTDTMIDPRHEKNLMHQGKVIKKTRIAWFYSPDKTMEWLEKMEEQGYNLGRMSKIGNSFYFYKGQPRKVKYHVDYLNKTDPTYYNWNIQNGWKLFFKSLSNFQCINVWGKEYTDTPPEFYSDRKNHIKQAKKLALMYGISFSVCIVLWLFVFGMQIIQLVLQQDSSYLFPIVTSMILLAECGFFGYRAIAYYFRVKKKYSTPKE